MNRTILHSDCNCFYASVELLHHPKLRGKPVVVGGDPEARHGIVLTADYTAKRYGVKTGMALWQAKQVCPDITFLPPKDGPVSQIFQNGTGNKQQDEKRTWHYCERGCVVQQDIRQAWI